MELSRQEYWSGRHFFLQWVFPTQGLNPHLLPWQAGSFTTVSPGKPGVGAELGKRAGELCEWQLQKYGWCISLSAVECPSLARSSARSPWTGQGLHHASGGRTQKSVRHETWTLREIPWEKCQINIFGYLCTCQHIKIPGYPFPPTYFTSELFPTPAPYNHGMGVPYRMSSRILT